VRRSKALRPRRRAGAAHGRQQRGARGRAVGVRRGGRIYRR